MWKKLLINGLFAVWAILLGAQSAFAGKMSLTHGEISGSFDHLHLEIAVVGVPQSNLPSGLNTTIDQLLQGGFLQIILLQSDSLPVLPFTPRTDQEGSGYSNKFIIRNPSAQTTQNSSDQTQVDIAFVVDIYNNTEAIQSVALSALAETLTDNNGIRKQGIRLGGQFVVKNQSPIPLDPTPSWIYQNFSKPNEMPQNFALSGTHRGLLATWQPATPVTYTGNNQNTRTPSQLLVVLFDTAKFTGTLEGAIVDDTAGQDKTVTCPVDLSSSSCIGTCTDANPSDPVYLKQTQPTADGLSTFVISNSGSFAVNELDPEATYVMVMQYLDGAKQTSCLTGQPDLLSGFLELNGNKEATPGDPRCFIVSAAYNSPFSKHVDIFRWVRDHFLLTNHAGQAFVQYYYDHAKPVADVIYAYPALQIPMQVLLFLPALFFYGVKFIQEGPAGAVPLTVIFMLGIVLLVQIRKRFKKC